MYIYHINDHTLSLFSFNEKLLALIKKKTDETYFEACELLINHYVFYIMRKGSKYIFVFRRRQLIFGKPHENLLIAIF